MLSENDVFLFTVASLTSQQTQSSSKRTVNKLKASQTWQSTNSKLVKLDSQQTQS